MCHCTFIEESKEKREREYKRGAMHNDMGMGDGIKTQNQDLNVRIRLFI